MMSGTDTVLMDNSQQRIPTVFLVGCLFALLLVAIEMWPAQLGRGISRSIDGQEQWSLAGANIRPPAPDADPVPIQPLAGVLAKRLITEPQDARQPASHVAPVPNQPNAAPLPGVVSPAPMMRLAAPRTPTQDQSQLGSKTETNIANAATIAARPVPNDNSPLVREPSTVIRSHAPALTDVPVAETDAAIGITGPPLNPSRLSQRVATRTERTTPAAVESETLQLPHDLDGLAPKKPLVVENGNGVKPPSTIDAITPDPYSANSVTSAWPHVPALAEQLTDLRTPPTIAWANQVEQQLISLQRQPELYSQGSSEILTQLRSLSSTGKQLANRLKGAADRANLKRTTYSLDRRLAVWTQVFRNADPSVQRQLAAYETQLDPTATLIALQAVESELRDQPENWQRFLSLSHIRDVASSNSFQHTPSRASVAVRVLNRLSETEFTPAQQAVIGRDSIRALSQELRKWLTVPIDLQQLLAHIEEYEIQPIESRNQPVSDTWNHARWSLFPTQQRLAQSINTHYRNANIRFAVTEEFLNRLVPAIQDVQAPVREQILGADVRGLSETSTNFRINLVPDESQIRMQLEGDGVLSASTRSTKGGVTLMNRNRARFFVQKMLLMDPRGVKLMQSESAAMGSTNLTGMRTRFDTFPILGSFVRRAAQKQAFETKAKATSVFESRVAKQARSKLDEQLQQQVATARQRMDEKLIQPLERMQLNPTALEMKTTEDRLTLRSRLASDEQLASFTSRPDARVDSLFSVQVHESAMNNFASQLNLSGKEGDIRDVCQEIGKQLGVEEVKIPDEVPEGVKIRLAKRDPVRFAFRDGRLMIAIRIDGLKYERRSWRNFEVRAYYTPTIQGFHCDLHREDYIELIGSRLKPRHQIALRGIFTKVFSKQRPITLIHPEIGKDPRLAMLDVSQFVIRDGWIGVSVSPHPKPSNTAARKSRSHFKR